MTEVTLRKAKQGISFTATKDGKKCSLFVFDGQPVCLKSVMVSLEHFL